MWSGLGIGYADVSMVEPVVVVEKSTASEKGWSIERIAGCYGDLSEARSNVLSADGLLSEPTYQTSSFTKGLFELTKPTCVSGDQPKGKVEFVDRVEDFEGYLFNHVYECGCGSCYLLDPNAEYGVGESFEEDELSQHITEQHKRDYEAYKARRIPEVASNKAQHELYTSDYDAWSKRYTSELHDESIHITLTPEQSMTEAVVTLYSFNWEHQMWCGDTSDVKRQGLNHREVKLPALKKGETVHIWLHNVDSQLSWGAVLNQTEKREVLMSTLEKEAERRLNSEDSDVYGLPPVFQGRGIELPRGMKAQINDDCCAC
jgi:hypothetical protein